MGDDPGRNADDDIHDLYEKFLHLIHQDAADNEALVREVLSREASLEKLRSACRCLLQNRPADSDFGHDLEQEAITIVFERFRHRTLKFVDVGSELFAGWLWKTWFNACRQAWDRHARRTIPTIARPGDEPIEHREPAVPADLWDQVLEAIDAIRNGVIHDAMQDWAGGLTVSESARHRAVARSTVCERRRRGVNDVQRILNVDDWPIAGG